MDLTDNEELIIAALRTLKPYEEVRITADKDGSADSFLLVRSSKIMFIKNKPSYYLK